MSKETGVDIHIETPELDKMLAVKDRSQAIGEFLEWLQEEQGWSICELDRDDFYPVRKPINIILAEYFQIDLNVVERERRAILDGLRASHAAVQK